MGKIVIENTSELIDSKAAKCVMLILSPDWKSYKGNFGRTIFTDCIVFEEITEDGTHNFKVIDN
jgi:hypothetical protein